MISRASQCDRDVDIRTVFRTPGDESGALFALCEAMSFEIDSKLARSGSAQSNDCRIVICAAWSARAVGET